MGRGGVTRGPTRAVTRPGPTLEGQTKANVKKSPDPGHDPGRDPAGSGPDFCALVMIWQGSPTPAMTLAVTWPGRGLWPRVWLHCSVFGLLLVKSFRGSP